jgi:hypothetical protein
MIKKIFTIATMVATGFYCHAQERNDSTKILNHYFGIQANQLLKQLLPLNNNNTIISNPYTLTYALHHARCKWGIEAGIGYDYQRVTDKSTPANHESKINDLFYRIGIGRKVMIGKRWEGGFGLDFAGGTQSDKTFSSSVTTFGNTTDSLETISKTTIKSSGGGLQLNLGFHISDRIMLGTESTLYFLKKNNKLNVVSTEFIKDGIHPDSESTVFSDSETVTAAFTITVPVALFLIIKF